MFIEHPQYVRYCESSPGGNNISNPGAHVRPEREGGNLFEGCWCPAGALSGFKKVGAPKLGIEDPGVGKCSVRALAGCPGDRTDGWAGDSVCSVVPSACNKGIVPHPAPKLLIQKLGDPRSLCSQALSVMPLGVV